MVYVTSLQFGVVVVWLLRWREGASDMNCMFVVAELLCFTSMTGLALRRFFRHFTAMSPWTSTWLHDFCFGTSNRTPIFLGNLHGVQLHFFWMKNTGCLNWQTSYFIQPGTSRCFLSFWWFWEGHFFSCASLRSNFTGNTTCSRGSINVKSNDFVVNAPTSGVSGVRILTIHFGLQLLGLVSLARLVPFRNFLLSTRKSSKRNLRCWKRSSNFKSSSLNFDKLNFDIVDLLLKKDFVLVCEHTSERWVTNDHPFGTWTCQTSLAIMHFCFINLTSMNFSMDFGKALLWAAYFLENSAWLERLRRCSRCWPRHRSRIQQHFELGHSMERTLLKSRRYFLVWLKSGWIYFNPIWMHFHVCRSQIILPGPLCTSASLCRGFHFWRVDFTHFVHYLKITFAMELSWLTSAWAPGVQ